MPRPTAARGWGGQPDPRGLHDKAGVRLTEKGGPDPLDPGLGILQSVSHVCHQGGNGERWHAWSNIEVEEAFEEKS